MKKITAIMGCSLVIIFFLASVFYLAAPYIYDVYKKQYLESASDYQKFKHRIRVAGDPWLGYFIARSPLFKKELAKKEIGLLYQTVDNFEKRFAGLEDDYDIVFATIDSYVKNGRKSGYKGVIVFAIDESNGGDGVVAHKAIKNVD
ncbi:hypothetical protein ACFL35_11825, partial [Candidatus Riflebacteria bacterium]